MITLAEFVIRLSKLQATRYLDRPGGARRAASSPTPREISATVHLNLNTTSMKRRVLLRTIFMAYRPPHLHLGRQRFNP